MDAKTQKKYMEMQTIQQEVMQLHKQVESLQQQKAELANTLSSIEELSQIKQEKDRERKKEKQGKEMEIPDPGFISVSLFVDYLKEYITAL